MIREVACDERFMTRGEMLVIDKTSEGYSDERRDLVLKTRLVIEI